MLAFLRRHGGDGRGERRDEGVRIDNAVRPVAVAVPIDDLRGGARKGFFEEIVMFGSEFWFTAFPARNIPNDGRRRPTRETGVEFRGLEFVADGFEHPLGVCFICGVTAAVAVIHDSAIA